MGEQLELFVDPARVAALQDQVDVLAGHVAGLLDAFGAVVDDRDRLARRVATLEARAGIRSSPAVPIFAQRRETAA
jgi:hypothetical protein